MCNVRWLVFFGLALILALAVPVVVSGQAGLGKAYLIGVVKADDGQPLASAKVVLRLLKSGKDEVPAEEAAVFETKTNKKGLWNYVGMAAGTWEITVSAEGYNPASRTCSVLELQANPKIELTLEKLERARSEAPPPGWLEKADELFFKKDYDGALALYRQYLERDPGALMVISAVGDCLMEKSDFQGALAQYQIVVDKTSPDPRNAPLTAKALDRIGECYMKAGDRARAVEYWKSSLAMSSFDAEVPFNIGEVLFSERKFEEAAHYYRAATEISPDWNEPYFKLGLVSMGLGEFDKARASFRKVAELDPYAPLAYQARDMLKELDKIKK